MSVDHEEALPEYPLYEVDVDSPEEVEVDYGYHSIGKNIQKLEEQHLHTDEKSSHSGKAYVPSKIRDIVTKSISTSDPKMSTGTLSDEKRALENEVGRLEDLLSSTRAERDEISSKYLAVSERVSISRRFRM